MDVASLFFRDIFFSCEVLKIKNKMLMKYGFYQLFLGYLVGSFILFSFFFVIFCFVNILFCHSVKYVDSCKN